MTDYNDRPQHPGLWLKETFKQNRTYYEWLVRDVVAKYPKDKYNINSQYWYVGLGKQYLNGRGPIDFQKARVLSAATGIPVKDLMLKHMEFEYAFQHWLKTKFYSDCSYTDLPPNHYTPEHRMFAHH